LFCEIRELIFWGASLGMYRFLVKVGKTPPEESRWWDGKHEIREEAVATILSGERDVVFKKEAFKTRSQSH